MSRQNSQPCVWRKVEDRLRRCRDQDLIRLFSRKAAEKMKLTTINNDNCESVSAVPTSFKTSDVVNELPKVFDDKLVKFI